MAGNEGRPVIKAARHNLANMTQAIVKPEITGHFELKQYMTDEVLCHTLVDRLDEESKMNLDLACGGSCMGRPYSEIQILLNNFTANDNNWHEDGKPRRALKQKAAGVIELDDFSALREDIARLKNQMNKMTMHQAQQMQRVQQMSTCCEFCGEGHTSDICPVNPESIYYVGQQARGPMNQNSQYSTTYNLNWRNHPNFSWGGNQNIRPQANYNHPPQPLQQSEESLTDMIKKLLIDNQKVMAENQQLRTEFRNLERQFGQIANNQNIRPVGAPSSDTEKNPKVNTVTLRNGRELVEVPKKKKEQFGLEEERVPKNIEVDKRNKIKSEQISGRVPPPFPQRLRKKNDDNMFHKFLDMLKQIHLSIPLVDMLCEVPKYAKYIKDIVANKRRLTEFKTGVLTEECTSRIKHKLPQKLKDPGSFTIPVRIGEIDVGSLV
ncbi:uncharacterized protein LOC107797506 [Nicotiana tabacum]|uniref:Uncharacterized protein LOC107797506 n=1 Tax=Nicotiana tabacum TaxID=4097 RepID=A0A1S4AGW4_TOBAC|nr:PREDICTED: uncharacterized protein LOC107797506 [Nicotiana tabacum]